MPLVVPRLFLVGLSLAIAVFSYYESRYYSEHASILGSSGADVSLWMWVFRCIGIIMMVFAAVLGVDLLRKLNS